MDNFKRNLESKIEGVDFFSPGYFHEKVIQDYVTEFQLTLEKYGFWTKYIVNVKKDVDMPLQGEVVGELQVNWIGAKCHSDFCPALKIGINVNFLKIKKRSLEDREFKKDKRTKVINGQEKMKKTLRRAFKEFAEEIGEVAWAKLKPDLIQQINSKKPYTLAELFK